MDPINLMLLNEAYRHGVYTEETLSEEELVSIEEWVEALIEEGYDLDDYSDEELYEAYLIEANRGEKYLNLSPNEIAKRRQPFLPRSGYKGEEETHNRQVWSRKGSGSVKGGDPSLGKTVWQGGRKPDGDLDRMRDIDHKRSRGRKTKGMNEELDLYDIVSEYLVSEGFCDSHEDADVIMANMSEEWRESIVNTLIEEGFVSPYKAPHAHGRSMDNPGRLSPAMKAMDKSDELQRTQPGSERQKMQTRRSKQLNKMFSAARRA